MPLLGYVAGLVSLAVALGAEPSVRDILAGVADPHMDAVSSGSQNGAVNAVSKIPEVATLVATAPYHQSEAFWRCAARSPEEVGQMQACLQEAFTDSDEKVKAYNAMGASREATAPALATATLATAPSDVVAAATAPVEPTLPAQAVGSSSGGLDELQSRMGRLDGLLGRIHAPPKPEAKPEAADASKHDAAALPLATSLVSGAGASASGGQAETVTSS
jgi:hypothetical protein